MVARRGATKAKTTTGGVAAFQRIIKEKNCPSSLLILCPDEVRTTRITQKLFATFFKGSTPTRIRLPDSDLRVLSEKIAPMSLFESTPVYLLSQVEGLKAAGLEQVLKAVTNNTHASCICVGTKLPAQSVFLKHFKKANALIELGPLEGTDRLKWISKEFKSRGIECQNQKVFSRLAELGESLDMVMQGIEHLELYAQDEAVTLTMLDELFPEEMSSKEIDFVSALLAKRRQVAEKLFYDVVHSGKSPLQFMALLSKTVFHCTAIANALNPDANKTLPALRQELRIPPWLFEKHLRVAKQLSTPELRSRLGELVKADSRFKGHSASPEAILGTLMHNFCSS